MNKRKMNNPILRFSPRAWAKLIYVRDISDNEVGAMAVTEPDDLLYVKDVVLIKQKVTSVSVSFDDEAIADYFDKQVDQGRKPQQFARIWLHSHPGTCTEPSSIDETTFKRVFDQCDWALLFIVARNGDTYARLRFNTGPGGEMLIPVCVDYSRSFEKADFDGWYAEYVENVYEDNMFGIGKNKAASEDILGAQETVGNDYFSGDQLIDEIELMEPAERQAFMDELAVRSDFWDEEMEVFND